MKKRVLLVPSFMCDTYTQIEESFVELSVSSSDRIEFIWLVRKLQDRYATFKTKDNQCTLYRPLYVDFLIKYNIIYVYGNISKYNFVYNIWLFYSLFKEYKIDAIYSHFGFERYYAVLIGKMFNKKTIWNEHMYWNQPGTKFVTLKKCFMKICVDYFIAVSSFIASTLPKGSKVFSINNMIKINPGEKRNFAEMGRLKQKLGISSKNKVILMVAAFRQEKRYDLALEVLREVCKKRMDVLFVFLGDGEGKRAFEDVIRKDLLLDRVVLPGHVNNVDDYYSIADVCMLTSVNEPCGYAVLEAMRSEIPFVAFNSGGPAEMLINQVTGYLINGENIMGFAAKLIDLIDNDEKRVVMGQNALKHVTVEFSRSKWIQQMKSYFAEILC